MKLYVAVLLTVIFHCAPKLATAQGGFHFGLKAGPTLATQVWNFGERRMTPTYHANVFIESRDPNDRGSLFAQVGLHNRGSSLTINNTGFGTNRAGYNFKNISLLVAAKKKVASSMNAQPYYLVGIRGEYNIADNLQELIVRDCAIFINNNVQCPYPDPLNLNAITYGITIGGGIAFSPDLSYQLQRPEIQSGSTNLSQLEVRNVSLEISLVVRFLREVIYTE